jgi:hypothetical protein
MNLLELAKVQMTDQVEVGTTGLKLIGALNSLVKEADFVIHVFENMSEEYNNNLVNTLGEEGAQAALYIYEDIKKMREALKLKGL